MKREQDREGYLLVDHSASPGLTEEEACRSGFDPALCGEGKVFEAATLTCSHCGVSVVKNPLRQRARANCPYCGNHYVCDLCYQRMQHADYIHVPYKKFADIVMRNGAPPPELLVHHVDGRIVPITLVTAPKSKD